MNQDHNRSIDRIRHILDAIKDIRSFVSGKEYSDFREDSRSYFACLYLFAVIGEAIARIDERILEKFEYPWYKVRSFRNFILHEYHAIDAEMVWDTILNDMPVLEKVIINILEDEP